LQLGKNPAIDRVQQRTLGVLHFHVGWLSRLRSLVRMRWLRQIVVLSRSEAGRINGAFPKSDIVRNILACRDRSKTPFVL
jgi:hypothetical protein